MPDPLVTTIIPVFNRPERLVHAVESVVAQDYRPIEILIVDDGSTDDTPSVAAGLAATHPFVRVIRRLNAGPGAARETGRRQARGAFLQYLDSDDLLLPGKFRAQVRGLLDHPECGVSYGYTRYRNRDGAISPARWKATGHVAERLFPSFLRERWWETATPLYRADVCTDAGPWSNLLLEEDWEYDCRVAALNVKLHFHPEFVAEIRDHDDGRLGSGSAYDPSRLAHRARAHELILGHARRAGVPDDAAEMRHFARALFLLARQCGKAGLATESRRLFRLSQSASGPRGQSLEFQAYSLLARAVGWTRIGQLACLVDSLRR